MTRLTDEQVLGRPPLPADERVAWGPGTEQFGDLRLPAGPGPHPVVVVVHGGCWRDFAGLHYMDALAVELAEAGWATWNVEFRTVGRGGGWPETFLDVAAAADHVRALAADRPLDPDRVVALGHSSGGHLALWLAARPRIPAVSPLHGPRPLRLAGVVSLAGIADLESFHLLERRACADGVAELLGGEPTDLPDRTASASPAALLPLGVPQLLVTGEDDPDVPADHVDGYARRALDAGDDVRHVRLPRAGHFEVVCPWSDRWPDVSAVLLPFLERVAPRSAS